MESFVGEIRIFAGNFAPTGWALCNGSLLSIAENDLLFALIGTTYGGDGQTTFALPDLRGRIPVHMGQNPSTGTTYNLGQKAGTETVTLTANQLPAHTHLAQAVEADGTATTPEAGVWAEGADIYTTDSPNTSMASSLVASEGGNQPHDNVMPFQVVNFIISLYGLYPSQS